MPIKDVNILIADDDQDDCLLMREAFKDCKIAGQLHFVQDGDALLDYLKRRTPYQDEQRYPVPDLILLDLNMPRMDGREALALIKRDPQLKAIPVVVLTTSSAEEDVLLSYSDGVNSFVTKPVSYSGLVEVIRALGHYWIDVVDLPTEGRK